MDMKSSAASLIKAVPKSFHSRNARSKLKQAFLIHSDAERSAHEKFGAWTGPYKHITVAVYG